MATALTRKPSPTPSDIAGVSSTPSLAQGMPLSSPSSAAIRSTPIPQTPSAGLSSSSLPISPSAIPAKDEQTKTSFLSDTTTLDPSSHSSSPHPPVKTGDSSSSSTTMEGDDLKTKPAAPRQSTAAPLISSSPTDDLFLPPSTDPPLSKNPLPSSSSSSPSPPSPGLPPISGSPPAPVPSENPQSSEGNEGEGSSSSSSSSSSANVIPPGGNSSSSSGRPSLSPVGENPSKIDRRIPPTSPATTSGVPVAPVYPNKFPVKVEPTSAGPTAGNICVRRERPKSKETGGGGAGPGGGGAKKTGEGSSEEQQQEDLSSGQLLDGYDSREKPLELSPYLDKGNKPKIVFIFINPTSGGNKAAAFTESGVCRLTMTTPFLCNVYIFDIREGDSGKKPGFLLLKAATEALGPLKRNQPTTTNGAIPLDPSKRPPSSNVLSGFFADPRYTGAKRSLSSRKQKEDREIDDDDIIRVLVAGGDGTVMWCASEAEAHHIDPNRIALGVIPYGTGNDFANAFGWKQRRGLRPFDVSMRTMRSLLLRWENARVVHHDLWNIFIVLKAGGIFTKINSHTRKKEVLQKESGNNLENMSFVMSNYFSMGVESRIGRGFDRHRGHSQLINKMTYGIEGVKAAWFKRTLPMDKIIDSLICNPGEPDERIIFRTANSSQTQGPVLRKAVSLVALNIPSFSAGNDIWATSHAVGLLAKSPTIKRVAKEIVQEKQRTGDGELEFLTFPSVTSLGLEFACHGRARRVNQGTGPWKILFQDLPATPDAKVYFQVDGEFFQMTRPLYVTIKHNRTVKVLASPQDTHQHA